LCSARGDLPLDVARRSEPGSQSRWGNAESANDAELDDSFSTSLSDSDGWDDEEEDDEDDDISDLSPHRHRAQRLRDFFAKEMAYRRSLAALAFNMDASLYSMFNGGRRATAAEKPRDDEPRGFDAYGMSQVGANILLRMGSVRGPMWDDPPPRYETGTGMIN
jgi:hypothetical protein